MSRLILLGAAVVALAGCSDLGSLQGLPGRYPDRYPDRTTDRGRSDDYSRTREYRRISSDAADYARRVDASLRIGSSQERRISNLLADRTARLLERTNARDHSRVYPFPRRFSGESRAARSFWSSADRDIERLLGSRDADVYRRYVRAGGRYDNRGQYDNRGRYDDRSTDRGRSGNRDRNDRDRDDDDRARDDGERRGSDRSRANRRDDRQNGQAGARRASPTAPARGPARRSRSTTAARPASATDPAVCSTSARSVSAERAASRSGRPRGGARRRGQPARGCSPRAAAGTSRRPSRRSTGGRRG